MRAALLLELGPGTVSNIHEDAMDDLQHRR